MGLGSVALVSLARAREPAQKYRAIAREGGDPILGRQKERTVVPSFREAAKQVHKARESTWRNEKHRQECLSSLERYAFDLIGDRPVNAIQTSEILQVLSPIWLKVPDTARRNPGNGRRGWWSTLADLTTKRLHRRRIMAENHSTGDVEGHVLAPRDLLRMAVLALDDAISETQRVVSFWPKLDSRDLLHLHP